MRATENYSLFETAEALGRPVGEMLTGLPGPLTNMELYLWGRFRWARERLRQQDHEK